MLAGPTAGAQIFKTGGQLTQNSRFSKGFNLRSATGHKTAHVKSEVAN
jgi:hypothetical protein